MATITARLEAPLAGARALRARLGGRWSVVGLLTPVALVGALVFGPRAAFVLLLSVGACMGLGVATRAAAGEPWRYLNPGSIITGLLLGLTLSADAPLFLILVGAAVAEVAGKHRFTKLGTNPFNPAALGRAAVAVIELLRPAADPAEPDVVTAASPLSVVAGGSPAPDAWAMLLGNTPGAIGETSALVLGASGVALLTLVVVKREATLAMLGTVVVLVLVLPATPEIYGHAPWVLNPLIYLVGGPIFLYAFFFATDPATTPNTRLGGLIFGAGAGGLGVLGRLYTTIPGPEMWAILIMNLATPLLDRWLRRDGAFAPAPGKAAEEGVRSFYRDIRAEPDATEELVCEGVDALDPGSDAPFEVLGRLVEEERSEVIERLRASGLRGCGGARFPAAMKWEAALAQPAPRALVVNGQEGEPDSFKDRALMTRQAHLVIEGAAIAAHVVEASEIQVVHPPGDVPVREALAAAIERLAEAHPGLAERVELVEGSGLYICGEESALLAFLEGERGEPRERPPHPTEKGLRGLPTVVHNVETLAWLPRLLDTGERFDEAPRLVSISGAVASPGVYAVERDVSLNELTAMAGGAAAVLGFAIGGPTGELLPASADSMRVGELPGTGTVRVVSSRGCPVAEARRAARFAAQETCGRCTPCRVGSAELERMWSEVAQGDGDAALLESIRELGDMMSVASACGLGRDAPKRALSVLRNFPAAVASHRTNEEHECDECNRLS